jgi:hypothetical protein
MQHGKEPALVASLDWGRPSIGFVSVGMAVDLKYVHVSVPNGFFGEPLRNVLGLTPCRLAAMLGLDGAP